MRCTLRRTLGHPVRRPLRRSNLGFTLVEICIALVVVALLGAVAYPAYTAQVNKARRGDGKQALVELAQRLERYYSERGTYAGATLGSSGIYGGTSPGGYYTLAITLQTADAFTITATPGGVMASDDCGTFRYNQLGTASLAPGASASLAACW